MKLLYMHINLWLRKERIIYEHMEQHVYQGFYEYEKVCI